MTNVLKFPACCVRDVMFVRPDVYPYFLITYGWLGEIEVI